MNGYLRPLALCVLSALLLIISMPLTSTVDSAEIDPYPPKHDFVDDEIRILFCTSCGFKQNFMEVKRHLEDRYPHLVDRVVGANYDVDPFKKVGNNFRR